MLDIKVIRESPQVVRDNLAKRGNPENIKMLDNLIALDRRWRQGLTRLNELRHERKLVTIEIAKLKKEGKDAGIEVTKAKGIDAEISEIEREVAIAEEEEKGFLMRLPNLLHESVPVGNDESENVQVRTWGRPPEFKFPVKNHIDLSLDLGIIDMERAGKVSGSRFYYLQREAVLLDMALMSFAMEEMVEKGYKPIEPPYLMRREAYEGVTALGDFEDVLYKIEN